MAYKHNNNNYEYNIILAKMFELLGRKIGPTYVKEMTSFRGPTFIHAAGSYA